MEELFWGNLVKNQMKNGHSVWVGMNIISITVGILVLRAQNGADSLDNPFAVRLATVVLLLFAVKLIASGVGSDPVRALLAQFVREPSHFAEPPGGHGPARYEKSNMRNSS